MKNILMLDLEGVIIAKATPHFKEKDAVGIRPYAKEFLSEIWPLFDEKYLNTCVFEERALGIMLEIFGIDDIKYHKWKPAGEYGKATFYHEFKDSRIIHVEDESPEGKEAMYIKKLGHEYIEVKGWYPYHAFGEKCDIIKKNDKELLRTIEKIKACF